MMRIWIRAGALLSAVAAALFTVLWFITLQADYALAALGYAAVAAFCHYTLARDFYD